MQSLTQHVAVSRALSDGMPRIIAKPHATFLATPAGAVWQVIDAEAGDRIGGGIPHNDSDGAARIFISAENGRQIRIYRFGIGERRSITAWAMLAQLERALVGDDRAA